MDWSIHHRIAQAALKMQILSFEAVSEILRQLGARAAAGEEVSIELWQQEGWVSPRQLEKLREAIEQSAPAGDGIGPVDPEAFATVADEPSESAEGKAGGGGDADSDVGGDGDGLIEETEPEMPVEADSDGFDEKSTVTLERSDDDQPDGRPGVGVADTVRDGDDLVVSETLRDGDFDVGVAETAFYDAQIPESESDDYGSLPREEDRYRMGRQLGRGGGGRVVEAEDRYLKRKVAMKILETSSGIEEKAAQRFISEAQAACQLEHPNIMPVYDVGVLDDGDVYYTMLLTRNHSLEDVLEGLRGGDEHYLREYSLGRLVSILKNVSQALDYAHDQGVIHRDMKPGNIMIGEFGEVLVMDWGLAEVSGEGVRTALSEEGEKMVETGHTLGTPAYMSPEQARGRLDELDARSDVYALGAVLYEMLVLAPPFDGDDALETMRAVLESEVTAPDRRCDHELWEIPDGLVEICMRALSRSPDDRHQSAGEFFDSLEQFTEGFRPRRARWHLEEGRRAAERYHEGDVRIEELTDEINKLSKKIDPWESIEKKRSLWQREDRRQELAVSRARDFGEAVTGFQKALANDPDCEPARRELAQLYWSRYCEAETAGDEFEQIYFDAMIRETGQQEYLDRLSRQVEVSLRTRPKGAEVTLFPYQELDRRLVVADERALGRTPLRLSELEVGRYLMVLEVNDRAVVRTPLYARRGEAVDMRVSLPSNSSVQSGFVFVAGGPCFVGGDAEAINPRARRRTEIGSFFCSRLPVTFRQYLEYLDSLPREEARQRAPRDRGQQRLLVRFDEEAGQWRPAPFFSERRAGELDDSGQHPSRWQLPVVGISGHDARAYCQWRSERDGRSYRLPTETEWEKAGRGVDGRLYPWGDRFDATFCKMQQSRPHQSRLEPVGKFVDDASPYGIRDLAGGVHEWCEGGDDDEMPIRGGSWDQGQRACRLASSRTISADQCARNIGMRLVYDIEFNDGWTGTQRLQSPDELPQ